MSSEPMKLRKVAALSPLPSNPRKITKEDFQRLVDSIRSNGFWEHRPLALEEQDAYDELDESLMEWYLAKYEGQ